MESIIILCLAQNKINTEVISPKHFQKTGDIKTNFVIIHDNYIGNIFLRKYRLFVEEQNGECYERRFLIPENQQIFDFVKETNALYNQLVYDLEKLSGQLVRLFSDSQAATNVLLGLIKQHDLDIKLITDYNIRHE